MINYLQVIYWGNIDMSIEETLITMKNSLLKSISELPIEKRFSVEIAKTTDYKNLNVNGTLFLVYRGESYGKNIFNNKNIITLPRNIIVTALGVFKSSCTETVLFYIDFVISSLSGLKLIESQENECIIPISAEQLDDDNIYNRNFAITFNVPVKLKVIGDK